MSTHQNHNNSENDEPQNETKCQNALLNELEHIELQKGYKFTMERFVLQFNNDPKQGIAYLIENELV